MGRAWTEKNPQAIPPLFAEKFRYFETPFEKPIISKSALIKLWQDVPVSQKNIAFNLEILSEKDNLTLAHFRASFTRTKNGSRATLDGIFSVKLNKDNLCTEFKWWWNTHENNLDAYNALIDSASLKNPTILNDFSQIKITINHEPHSETAKYHYNFLLEIPKEKMNSAIIKIQKQMFPGWYFFFWNKKTLFVVFNTRKFKINLPGGWQSANYKTAQSFGKKQGISVKYLDFKKYFRPS